MYLMDENLLKAIKDPTTEEGSNLLITGKSGKGFRKQKGMDDHEYDYENVESNFKNLNDTKRKKKHTKSIGLDFEEKTLKKDTKFDKDITLKEETTEVLLKNVKFLR
jgi:hypothetical protein